MIPLTIISVSFKSKKLLEINYKLVKALNPNTAFRWIVVENTPEADQSQAVSKKHECFEVLEGIELSELEMNSFCYGSLYHGKGLNKAIELVNTDFVLTLDPDCFIFRPNWIEEILQYAKQESIVFLGTPYHLRRWRHYRHFPNVVCMLINRSLISDKIDFLFPFKNYIKKREYNLEIFNNLHYHASHKNGKFFQFFLKKKRKPGLKITDFPVVLKFILQKLFPQMNTEKHRDTGYIIFQKYARIAKSKCFEIYAVDERNNISKCIDFFLPDRSRMFPRNTNGYVNEGSPLFRDLDQFGEQFFWKGGFFAFHINLTWDPKWNKEQAVESVLACVENYINASSGLAHRGKS